MNNESVRYVKISDRIQVTLDSNASTGYLWKLASANDFELLGSEPAEPYNPHTMGIGSSIAMIYTLKPKRVGELILRFEKRRPWEKNTDPVGVHEEVIMVSE